MFRQPVHLDSFPACCRQANVTPIPKGPPSSSVDNYQPISITSVLSTVFEPVVSVRLKLFMERSGVIPCSPTQFAYRKGLGTCDALLCASHTLQSALESGKRLGSYKLISQQPLIWSTIRELYIQALFCGYCMFCVVYIDTVSIKSITARYGGRV